MTKIDEILTIANNSVYVHDTDKEAMTKAKEALKKEIKACLPREINHDHKAFSAEQRVSLEEFDSGFNLAISEIRANIDKLFGEKDPVDSGK